MKHTHLKGTTMNTLGYAGMVTLYQHTGTKKTVLARKHNEGGRALFNYLADCLLGDFAAAKSECPTKVMLLNINDDGSITKASNTSFIHILTKPERVYNETDGVVRYSFIVPQDMLSTSFNAIGLYPASATEADLEDYSAYCSIALDSNSLSLSTVLVIDWELHISNKDGGY